MNSIQPGIVSVFHSKKPISLFHSLENITRFLNACKRLGVPEESLFAPPDLALGNNVVKVVAAVMSLGETVSVPPINFHPPLVDPHKPGAESFSKEDIEGALAAIARAAAPTV